MIDADIDNLGVDAVMTRQNGNRCAAVEKVVSHLSGDVFRVGAHAFLCDAVVRGENEEQLSPEPWRNFSLNDGDAPRQLFQLSQASLRLGQGIKSLLRGAFDRMIQRPNLF